MSIQNKITLLLATFVGITATANAVVNVNMEPVGTQYRDLAFEGRDGQKANERFAREMTQHMQQLTGDMLPPGAEITITFIEVDMAGNYEPQLDPEFNDVRIMTSIYAPYLEFSYIVSGEDGDVLKTGEAKLTDPAWMNNIRAPFHNSDQLFYEKELMTRWAKEEFRGGF